MRRCGTCFHALWERHNIEANAAGLLVLKGRCNHPTRYALPACVRIDPIQPSHGASCELWESGGTPPVAQQQAPAKHG